MGVDESSAHGGSVTAGAQEKATAAVEASTNVASTAAASAKDVAAEAASQVSDVVALSKQQLGSLVDQTKGELTTQLDKRAAQAATGLSDLSMQLRALAEGRTNEAGGLAGYVRDAQRARAGCGDALGRGGSAGPAGGCDGVRSASSGCVSGCQCCRRVRRRAGRARRRGSGLARGCGTPASLGVAGDRCDVDRAAVCGCARRPLRRGRGADVRTIGFRGDGSMSGSIVDGGAGRYDPATQPKQPDKSLGELFSDLTHDFSELFRKEVELAKVETKEEALACWAICRDVRRSWARRLARAPLLVVGVGVVARSSHQPCARVRDRRRRLGGRRCRAGASGQA